MAKKKAAGKKTLQPHKDVVVKSHTYGEHTRAARGSRTPVALNAVLLENVKKTALINGTAKRVHDLLKHAGEHFKERMLWQEILSRMRKGASDDVMGLLMTLEGMELNRKYPLHRFARPYVQNVRWEQEGCELVLGTGYSHWRGDDTEYGYEVFLLALGKKAEDDGLVSAISRQMPKGEREGEMPFAFTVPRKVDYYLVCLHFMTGKNGKRTETLASRGMRIVKVGRTGKE